MAVRKRRVGAPPFPLLHAINSRLADKGVVQVEGPQRGHAVMLQGGEVEHLAARARGVRERISTITSYRSGVPTVYDSSYMTNIRPYADLDSLYPEWTRYRLRKLRDEIDNYLGQVERDPKLALDRAGLERLVAAQTEYLRQTARQMIAPQEQQRVLTTYGSAAYYDAPRIWAKVQALPQFAGLAASADRDRVWMAESVYWMDLQHSAEALRQRRPLRSTGGRLVWDHRRPFFMGDELLRQGLNELFLDWLGASGLWALYCQDDVVSRAGVAA